MIGPWFALAFALGAPFGPLAHAAGECLRSDALAGASKVALLKGRWLPEAHARLSALLKARGATAPGFDPCRRPLAVFDWDGTSIAGDVGEEVFAAALEQGYLLPSDALFALIPEARREAIKKAWPTEAGRPPSAELRAEMHAVYAGLCSERGHEECYAFLAQVFAGRTEGELETWAAKVIDRALSEPGRTETLPSAGGPPLILRRGMELRLEMRDLTQALVASGFDVYVVSASVEWAVRAMVPRYGLPREQAIGLRTAADGSGKLTTRVVPPIPYRAGKVLAIRTRIAPGGRVPVFAAGDSLGDLDMLDAATGEALLFDRGDYTLGAHATARGFILQPVFETER
jgi:phosphoserine phosphatase